MGHKLIQAGGAALLVLTLYNVLSLSDRETAFEPLLMGQQFRSTPNALEEGGELQQCEMAVVIDPRCGACKRLAVLYDSLELSTLPAWISLADSSSTSKFAEEYGIPRSRVFTADPDKGWADQRALGIAALPTAFILRNGREVGKLQATFKPIGIPFSDLRCGAQGQ